MWLRCDIIDYTDSEILLAILNQHTLNPVLATVVDVVLECTNRYSAYVMLQQIKRMASC